MHSQPSRKCLSPGRQRLLQMMQRLNFGRMESLWIRHGEPVFNPPPRVLREVKFGGDNGPRPEIARTDFILRKEHVELFACLDEMGEGTIDILEVRHGLPFRMTQHMAAM